MRRRLSFLTGVMVGASLSLSLMTLVAFELSSKCVSLTATILSDGFQAKHLAKTKISETSNGDQVLFGTLTCATDILPIDQMLPHQLHQSVSTHFNHRVLYVASTGDHEQRNQHSKMLEKIKSQNLIDELVSIDDVNAYQLATRVMEEKTAREFAKLGFADYNKAMLAFLLKCIDVGYDHCAWLDPDIFVHGGKIPWVDQAVERHNKNRSIVYSRPRSSSGLERGFSSRYFIYHREALPRLLPFTSDAPDTALDTFETLLQDNMMRKFGNDVEGQFGRSENNDSWVIHPPDDESAMHEILGMCANEERSLRTLIDIVEKGSEDGEQAFSWRGNRDDDENMDAAGWGAHLAHQCNSHDFWLQLLKSTG